MAIIRYQPEELLRLRESPLVVKPDSLPPIEEWMGPLPDPSVQKKNARDQGSQLETTNQRRSGLFESRHISRTSNSDDLILGPPKTSFASATRGFGKSIDATDRSFKASDHDDTKQERYGGFRDKFFKDREYGEREKDSERRDSRPHLTNGRRMNREDREDWSGRPRRNFGQEEDRDRRPRRSGDIERWDGRDSRDHRDQQEGGERPNRDQGRFPGRRDTLGRAKHDPPWYRDGEPQETGELEEDKTPIRNREWRRGLHGPDRDWNRPVKQEQDPEWMDSTSRSDTKEAHTQEDFQRWKERMKAGATQASADTKKDTVSEPPKEEPKDPENERPDGKMFSDLDPSLQADTGLDNFFGFWGERKGGQDAITESTGVDSKKEIPPAKPTKSSRFAGFFSAQNETKEADTSQPCAPRPASTDADQEGFQRILQMLGGNKSRNATPQAEEASQSRPSLIQMPQSDFAKPPPLATSPLRETFNRQEYMSIQEQVPRDRAPPGLENLAAQKVSKESDVHSRDTEFLLRLMQQSKISTQTPTRPNPAPLQSPGGQSLIDLLGRSQGVQAQKTPVYIEDPAIANFRRPDMADPRNQLRRRPTGGPTGYFDEMPYPGASSGNHTPNNPPGLRPQGPLQPSMGIQRPPGLDQVTPAGWPNQQMQQQGNSNQMMFAPGLPTPQARNMNPNFSSAHPMPLPAGMTPPVDRQPFQRGASASGPAGFAPPPGIMPPPGYLNMNAPPPSAFPPMPHSDAMMNMSHGHPGQYGAGPQQGLHQPSSRQLLDMFMQHGGNPGDGSIGARNGAGMMGPAGPYR
ncbi:hypothetical protein PRK78_003231 [Emydomyces testavorans]|uniref:Uncharacterized protein n=1 Tax=Emydomyces testavorans TaxID=2070801 RepID=A0AAF0IKE0_9EURO|nr:hypothetical protein PRK78_003231 [Emydomyces testavorans]